VIFTYNSRREAIDSNVELSTKQGVVAIKLLVGFEMSLKDVVKVKLNRRFEDNQVSTRFTRKTGARRSSQAYRERPNDLTKRKNKRQEMAFDSYSQCVEQHARK